MTLRNPLFALLTVGLVACGKAPAPNETAVYGKLTGQITSTATTPPTSSSVRVALAWYSQVPAADGSQQVVDVTQDVAVTTGFPASYELAITELPPANTLFNGIAVASVLVYDDANGNGKLDFATASDAAFADHLLGYPGDTAAGTYILYNVVFVQDDTAAASSGFPKGFSILKSAWTINAAGQEIFDGYESHAIDAPLGINVGGDPALDCYLLEPYPSKLPAGPVAFGFSAPPCPGNVPFAGGYNYCSYVGAQFYTSTRELPTSASIAALCGSALQTCSVAVSPVALPDGTVCP
jgi:hypothetical protein